MVTTNNLFTYLDRNHDGRVDAAESAPLRRGNNDARLSQPFTRDEFDQFVSTKVNSPARVADADALAKAINDDEVEAPPVPASEVVGRVLRGLGGILVVIPILVFAPIFLLFTGGLYAKFMQDFFRVCFGGGELSPRHGASLKLDDDLSKLDWIRPPWTPPTRAELVYMAMQDAAGALRGYDAELDRRMNELPGAERLELTRRLIAADPLPALRFLLGLRESADARMLALREVPKQEDPRIVGELCRRAGVSASEFRGALLAYRAERGVAATATVLRLMDGDASSALAALPPADRAALVAEFVPAP